MVYDAIWFASVITNSIIIIIFIAPLAGAFSFSLTKIIMGRTKELLEEDWERVWLTDYMYKMEQLGREAQEEMYREPAEIKVIDKRKTKKKDESAINILPF